MRVTTATGAAFEAEMRCAVDALRDRAWERASRALERAHVLGQAHAWLRLRVHGPMLRYGWVRRDIREILGQIPRLLLAVPGSWLGLVPWGNTGGANVPMFRRMPIPDDLARMHWR